MFIEVSITTVLQVLLVFVLVLLPTRIYGTTVKRFLRSCLAEKEEESQAQGLPAAQNEVNSDLTPVKPVKEKHNEPSRNIQLYKELYFKLQNLEKHPQILPQARDLLISLFNETLADALNSLDIGILSVENYTSQGLASFLQTTHDKIACQWEQYVVRRRAGSPKELFQDKLEAEWWLRQIAPVKFVDGAWLGHINKITTPFALRRATKDAWQVLSEELGDGDPRMNHVRVYSELMKDIGAGLPEADSADFIHSVHQLDEECVWKAAVAQLLISLFPHEFLPEILGFNLQFEGLTMETMKAAKELEELGLNPYYFILHISIDNADSGHTAMAMEAVVKYMNHILDTQGRASAQKAWRRVQTGFILSAGLTMSPECPSRRRPKADPFPRSRSEADVVKIFQAKAPAGYKIHCGSHIKLGGRRLDDWLEPNAFAAKEWQLDFLEYLSNFRPWVRKGDSSRSKLMHEFSWGGKMFGSFTHSEVEVVKRWIDAQGVPNPKLYWSFVGRSEVLSSDALQKQDIRVDCPVLSSPSITDSSSEEVRASYAFAHQHAVAASPTRPDMTKLLPLWFTSPCLLESFVCIPSKTTTTAASAIVRLLRAQYGFEAEGPAVAGMDEVRRVDTSGIVELGLEMIDNLGLPQPASLKCVLDTWPSDFALKMLEMSVQPMSNSGLLIGLAWAFAGLHNVMKSSPLLATASKAALMQMVRREQDCLEICSEEIRIDKDRREDFYRGYHLGKAEIASCFSNDINTKEFFP